MKRPHLLLVVLIPSLILTIPLAAMIFRVEGWAWGPGDFVVFWVLIASVVFAYLKMAGKLADRTYRMAAGLALGTAFTLVWVNGAVGIIGSENNPANLLYSGVLGIGLLGAVLSRLEPRGLARALYAMAAWQFLVPVVALLVWPDDFNPGVGQVFALNGVFVASFGLAGTLFRATPPRSSDLRTPASV